MIMVRYPALSGMTGLHSFVVRQRISILIALTSGALSGVLRGLAAYGVSAAG